MESFELPPMSARAFVLKAGQTVRITDTAGGQPGDLVAFGTDDHTIRFSQSRTRVECGKYRITAGDSLWAGTQPPVPMLTVTADTCGFHDLLYTPCCRYALHKRFGADRDGCLENLAAALEPYGMSISDIPDPLNLFFNVGASADGLVRVLPPVSAAGAYITLQAAIDCLVAVAACAVPQAGRANSGYRITVI